MKNLILLSMFLLMGCLDNGEFVKNQTTGNALGTTYSIIYLSHKELDFQKEIDSVFRVVNRSMSTYIQDSDISRINNGEEVVVDHMFKEVFVLSKKVNFETNGYFDPTVGTLVNAWGFGPGKQMALDSTEVDSLLQFVGFDMVAMTSDGRIQKKSPEIFFDFNAIAKGYAIDRLGTMLEARDIENYLVEVGGEVLVKGENKIKLKPWLVGVDHPHEIHRRGSAQLVHLKDVALASSGNYRKFRVDSITGIKYVHTIDPKTGFTKNSNVLATNVVAKTCAMADAYATAFMVMDIKSSKTLLERHPELEAYIIYLGEGGETKEFMTQGFKTFIAR